MAIGGLELFALLGFALAAWSVLANDSIQTLGTFLSSNGRTPWWGLWLYTSSIVLAVVLIGLLGDGDLAFGRLNNLPYPETGIMWWHALPPLALLILTRYGMPVSTTFLVLTLFALTGGAASEGVLTKMIIKSGLGYLVAILAGGAVYMLVARSWERRISRDRGGAPSRRWFVAQWCTTAFLWSQWLMQDLANMFVYLPRTQTPGSPPSFDTGSVILAAAIMLSVLAVIFYRGGGRIQQIVRRKINTTDVRSATVVDLIFGLILFLFKEVSDIPMSTTWVFLGLLAGREIAISVRCPDLRARRDSLHEAFSDVARAAFGLITSIVLACLVFGISGAAETEGRGEIDLMATIGTLSLVIMAWALSRRGSSVSLRDAGSDMTRAGIGMAAGVALAFFGRLIFRMMLPIAA